MSDEAVPILIQLTDGEATKLIAWTAQTGEFVDLSFGPGWCGIEWTPGTPIPAALLYLGRLRGVLNENMDGAGI